MTWPTHHLSSYSPCAGCGAHCDRGAESSAAEPCWGRVLFDPGLSYDEVQQVHRCTGHECADHRPTVEVKQKESQQS